jgi:hypothetical protein
MAVPDDVIVGDSDRQGSIALVAPLARTLRTNRLVISQRPVAEFDAHIAKQLS